ncbi:hypothetical protein KF840_07985 [bacterium]|nr:hypothetical protein [bacterium]
MFVSRDDRPRWASLLLAGAAALALLARVAVAADAPGRGDPAARLSSAPQASEMWNVTARLDGGYALLAWFFITNEGPGEQSAAALWYLVHPDGRVAEYRNGRTRGYWTLSADRRRIAIASSSLDLGDQTRRLAIDSTSQRVRIDLRFAAAASPPWPAPASSPTAALRTDVLQVATPVTGTIWEGGMATPLAVTGTATVSHTWMDESVPRLLRRRIEFIAEQPGLALYLADDAPASGAPSRWLGLASAAAGAYRSSDLEVTLGPPTLTADRRYPVPDHLLVRNGRLSLDIHPQRVLLRADPLDAVPQPFRFLFSLQVAPQWLWVDATFQLQLAADAVGGPVAAEGRGILGLVYVNPLSRPR